MTGLRQGALTVSEMIAGMIGAVSIALINMVGAVMLAWIKARYGVEDKNNGVRPKT